MCERVSAAGRTLWPVEPITANVHPSQSPDKLAHGHGGKAGHFWITSFDFFPWSINCYSVSACLLFIFICLCIFCIDHWGWLSYLSLLSFGTLHSNGNIFPFLLCFLLLFFSQLFVRPPQTAILLFCISFPWGWSLSLSPVQCHEPPSIVHRAHRHSVYQI